MLDKELLRQIKNADEIIYISDNIQDGPSGYSRPPSGARGSTLNTQLHPSGSSIIEDSRRGGKDVAGGRAREMHSPFGGERSEPVSRIVFMPYDTESKSVTLTL